MVWKFIPYLGLGLSIVLGKVAQEKHRWRFFLSVLLGSLLALGFPALTSGSESSTTHVASSVTLVQQGQSLYESGQLTAATAIWRQALAQQEAAADRVVTLNSLAIAYQALGELAAATEVLEAGDASLQAISPEATPNYWSMRARLANSRGALQWVQGDFAGALQHWQAATAAYQQAEDRQGELGSLMNQAMALRALGLLSQSEALLGQLAQQFTTLPDNDFKALGLRQLGSTLRQVGKLNQAEQALEESVLLSQTPLAQGLALVELGNTHRALAKRAANIGQEKDAQASVQAAIADYQQASQLLPSQTALRAQLNQLSLWVEIGQGERAMTMLPELMPAITALPTGRESIYARLNLAHSLMCLYPETPQGCTNIALGDRPSNLNEGDRPSVVQIGELISKAAVQAESSRDRKAQAYALGQLGALYELTHQWSEAQDLTQRALLLLEGLQAPEMRYRWEWQQGRLYTQQQQFSEALTAYRRSVKTLADARGDLLTIDPEVQFSFRDNVEPVYREFIDLLLRDTVDAATTQGSLQEAIDQANALKLAEIENFLGCTLSHSLQIDQALEQVDPTAAFLYPIVLRDRIEVIFKLPGQPLQHQTTPISQATVDMTLDDLRRALWGRDGGRVIERASQVYQWLIGPIEANLTPDTPIETLVFVLDGSLRDIPMSVLYDIDNQQYLVEKPYSLVLLPSAQLFDLRASDQQTTVLGAGVSEARTVEDRQFEALKTDVELATIQTIAPGEVLLDGQFTLANLRQRFSGRSFSIVHLATHGKFSSDPEETYVLAYDALLRAADLEALLQNPDIDTQALELLVLSACQTAVGDNRATLGLAGLAVRSGAKSTLATLWQVSDDSTVELMSLFYEALSQPNMSKAAALHQAQQQLLQQPQYQNPYYWAPYILVGNWR